MKQDFITSFLVAAFQAVMYGMWKQLGGISHASTKNKNRESNCWPYSLLLEQVPPAEVRSCIPSLSAAPENFPTASQPGTLHAHEATHNSTLNIDKYFVGIMGTCC